MDCQFNYNLITKKLTNHGLAQRAYALLPHITNVVPEDNLMEFTHQGTILIDRYQEELHDHRDFNLLCNYTCHVWSYSQKEAKNLISDSFSDSQPERVVL